jgi:hypothetical protein
MLKRQLINLNNIPHVYLEHNENILNILIEQTYPFLLIKNRKEFKKIKMYYSILVSDNTDAYFIDNCAVIYMDRKYTINIRNLLLLSDSSMNEIENQINNRYHIEYYKKYQNTFVSAFLNFSNKDDNTLDFEYFRYFTKIAKTNIPIILFLDKKEIKYANLLINYYPNVHIIYIDNDYLLFNSDKPLPKNRNFSKDTKEYIQFMNNKIIFMDHARKLNIYNTNHFVWLDFRLFHIFKNEIMTSSKLIDIATRELTKKSYFSGGYKTIKSKLDEINWRFLGGFFILDSESIIKLKEETIKLIESIPIFTWEVNIWAIIEYNTNFDFGWFQADHNDTILFNF